MPEHSGVFGKQHGPALGKGWQRALLSQGNATLLLSCSSLGSSCAALQPGHRAVSPSVPWQAPALSFPFLSSGRGLLAVLEHGPVLGQTARHSGPFQSLEVTLAPGPGGQIPLWDTGRHVASPSPLQLALEPGRHCGKAMCHLEKDRFSPCLPHQLHQAPLPTLPTQGHPACPSTGGRDWCHQPALHWRVHTQLAACPADNDLLGREKPCVEFFPLRRQEEEKDWVSLFSLISGEAPSGKGLRCRPEMLLLSNTQLLSGCSSWGEQQRGRRPCREVLCCPLVLGSGPAQLVFL